MKIKTEALVHSSRTSVKDYVKCRIDNTADSDECRMCSERGETA